MFENYSKDFQEVFLRMDKHQQRWYQLQDAYDNATASVDIAMNNLRAISHFFPDEQQYTYNLYKLIQSVQSLKRVKEAMFEECTELNELPCAYFIL